MAVTRGSLRVRRTSQPDAEQDDGKKMIKGATVRGLSAVLVDVQIGLRAGNAFRVVGLGQAAVQEARERLIHAFEASGFEWPDAAVTVNLAPGDVPKEGTTLDLAMALAVLEKTDQIQSSHDADVFAIGGAGL